jgi:hypothetical protein
MTNNRNLGDIFKQIVEDDKNKFDTNLVAKNLRMDSQGLIHDQADVFGKPFQLTDWATTQLASKVGIPVRYFKNCPPELQAENFNYWAEKQDTSWLLRGRDLGDGNRLARAILSAEHYSKIDNGHIVEILQKILGNGEKTGYGINMWHLDDGGFHLRVTFDDLAKNIGTLKDGTPDTHKVGLHIINSEVGKRSISIAPMVYRLVCTNGLMAWRNDGEIFTQRHVHLKEHEIYGRVAEAIGGALKAGNDIVEELIMAKQTAIINPLDIIAELAQEKQYSRALTDSLSLSYAANQAQTGSNVFSLVQAITETAQQASHPDTRIELERDAGRLMAKLLVA